MIRALAFSVLATGAPHAPVQPIVVHLSPTQTCMAAAAQFNVTATTTELEITGLVCAADKIFRDGFEGTGA